MTTAPNVEVTLKPCPAPWCAGHEDEVEVTGYRGMKFVVCGHCGCATPDEATEAEAIAAWNTRASAADNLALLREAVAKAICRADPSIRMGDAEGVVEQRVNHEWREYLWQADAALAALQSAIAQQEPPRGHDKE